MKKNIVTILILSACMSASVYAGDCGSYCDGTTSSYGSHTDYYSSKKDSYSYDSYSSPKEYSNSGYQFIYSLTSWFNGFGGYKNGNGTTASPDGYGGYRNSDGSPCQRDGFGGYRCH
ncbi:MAG: hypothetical protein V4525_08535 [Pseudomonadota bacterium]